MTAAPGISAAAFAAKWRDNARREHASSQEHFIDLCRLLGVPTPNEADPTGESYTFEAGAERLSTGRQGWADVWKRGHFGWEYKGAHADLARPTASSSTTARRSPTRPCSSSVTWT